MMYQKSGNYVACVKVDGKILREDADGVVNLPFGAEFSILLKNLNSVRAVAKVTVDGIEASGHGIIIPANGSVDLERFLKRDGDMSRGNKFKFIERTAGIEEHKGIGAEDGLIRIEYLTEVQPEVRKTVVEHVQHVYRHPWYWNSYPYWPNPYYGGQIITSSSVGSSESFMYQSAQGAAGAPGQSIIQSSNMQAAQTQNVGAAAMNMAETSVLRSNFGASSPTRSMQSSADPGGAQEVERSPAANNVGITVPGAESNQRFSTGEWFKTETASHVIVLQLRGIVGGKPVVAAVTVKTKKKCPTCGTASKSNVQFCGKCGTSLSIL